MKHLLAATCPLLMCKLVLKALSQTTQKEPQAAILPAVNRHFQQWNTMPPGPDCGEDWFSPIEQRGKKAPMPVPFKRPLKILKWDQVLTQCWAVIMQARSSMGRNKNKVRKLVQFATVFVQWLAFGLLLTAAQCPTGCKNARMDHLEEAVKCAPWGLLLRCWEAKG